MVRCLSVGASCVGGVETGGTRTVCAIGSGPDDVRAETRFETTTPDETLMRAAEFFRGHRARLPCAAIGIASFGPLDLDPASPTVGFITETPKPGWSWVDVAGCLGRALSLPTVIDTDVNAAVLAESRWGAGIGHDPLVYLTVGTGIGGGVLVAGHVLHGLVHPEMGHMRVPRDRDDAFRGVCPFHGDCLEGLASGPALLGRRGLPGEALAVDDPVWALEARYLALGLVNVITVLSPRRIVVGGGVMGHPTLLDDVRSEVLRLLAGYVRAPAILKALDTYIVTPHLGARVGVVGALALALQQIGE